MYCEICSKKISSRKHLFNIFKLNIHHICELCYKKYPLIPKRSIIPIKGGVILWQSLIQTHDEISPIAHMSFYKPYIIDYVTHYHDYILLIYDDLDEKTIELLDKMLFGNIYLLTLYENIGKKENNYEI